MRISDTAVRWLKKHFRGSLVLPFLIAINPVPASRPRVTRWGTHYSKNYTQWMKQAGEYIPSKGNKPFTGPVMVLLEHVVEKPKTTKKMWPRGDVDNYSKGALDAITKAESVWHDDDQVVALFVTKRFTEPGEDPGTHVTVMEVEYDT